MIYPHLRLYPSRGAILALALMLCVSATERGHCQSCPTEVETEGNSTIIIGPTLNVGSCPLFDQGYMQVGDILTIDARAELSGHCDYQVLSGIPATCTVINGNGQGEYRTVNNIAVKYHRPGSGFEYSLGTINGKDPQTGATPYYMPTLDSTNPTNSTGPKTYETALFGEYSFSVQAFVNTTMCNIGPGVSTKPMKTVHAVDCVPHISTDSVSGKVVRLQDNGTTYKIYPPSGRLTDAVEAAKNTWNAALTAQGINLQFTRAPCAVNDPTCILVVEELPPLNPIACGASSKHGDEVSGYIDSSSRISVRDDSWPQDYLNWLLTHELGHLLGLGNTNCPLHKSVMWGNQPCGSLPTTTPAPATTPTPSDTYAMKKTSYGNASILTCPLY